MKNHLIIGNPISHSLSPKIHNYWFKENNIDGNYDKISPDESEIEKILDKIKSKERLAEFCFFYSTSLNLITKRCREFKILLVYQYLNLIIRDLDTF